MSDSKAKPERHDDSVPSDCYAYDCELEISSGDREERVTIEQTLDWLRRTRDMNAFSQFGRRCLNRAIGALLNEQAKRDSTNA